MFKRLCAVALLFFFTGNTLTFAEEWVFGNNQTSNTQYSNVSQYTQNNGTSNYVFIDDDTSEEALSGHVFTNTNPQTNTYTPVTTTTTTTTAATTSNKKSGTFSENHPIITGVGIGALALGVLAVGFLLSDSDDDHHRHHDKAMSHDSHHRDYHHNHHYHHHDYSHNHR